MFIFTFVCKYLCKYACEIPRLNSNVLHTYRYIYIYDPALGGTGTPPRGVSGGGGAGGGSSNRRKFRSQTSDNMEKSREK